MGAGKTNFPREVDEAALAHTIKDKAEAAYARSDVFENRRKMMEAWAGYLAQEAGKVVRIGWWSREAKPDGTKPDVKP
jgi:hypothetical protein